MQVKPVQVPHAVAARAATAPPLRLAEGLAAEPVMTLAAAATAAPEQLAALAAWNAAGKIPLRSGFARPLPESHRVQLDAAALEAADFAATSGGYSARSVRGDLVWGTVISVREAHRLRLHLTEIRLPEQARLWVYGLGEEPVELGLELLRAEGDLWTPSVAGDWLFLEVEVPREAISEGAEYGFSFGEVMEVVELGPDGAPRRSGVVTGASGECLVDATCVGAATLDVVEPYRLAVAHLQFIEDDSLFLCSGALMNDTDETGFIPYLLTANHCFSSQSTVDTLESFWDYRSATCNGAEPDPLGKPRSVGGTLLATGEASDFTFLRLHAIPPDRVFLGWIPQVPPDGTILHRISHPAGVAQKYSRSRVRSSGVQFCDDAPRPQNLYAEMIQGATFGGSSGAPVIVAGGFVVGQLSGGCGGEDGCDYRNSEIDGAFVTTFPAIQGWLQPASSTTPCVPSSTTLCIDDQPGDRRFEAKLQFQNNQTSGAGQAIPLDSLGVTRGGLFWIGNAANPEMLLKVINACVPSLGNHYWVFYAATTNQGLVTTVRDTRTGRVWTRTNPLGSAAAPVQDTRAFPCN
ncbi:MAG TPA: trypsin-like peptidase domain-containing protein [Thermoanaerobaculia bacterium]|nr:trypsin-like peptidase domain-containing protein [Thermoanaerobaculia bacterium]